MSDLKNQQEESKKLSKEIELLNKDLGSKNEALEKTEAEKKELNGKLKEMEKENMNLSAKLKKSQSSE